MKTKLFRKLTCTGILIGAIAVTGSAQLPGPGAKRDMERIEAIKKGSVLRKDSVKLTDVISIVDPETGSTEEQVVVSTYSIYDYCRQLLGMNDPDILLKGMPVEITNPETYEPMVILWNPSEAKIDTVK